MWQFRLFFLIHEAPYPDSRGGHDFDSDSVACHQMSCHISPPRPHDMSDSKSLQRPPHTSQRSTIRLPCRTFSRLVLSWVLKKINKSRTPPAGAGSSDSAGSTPSRVRPTPPVSRHHPWPWRRSSLFVCPVSLNWLPTRRLPSQTHLCRNPGRSGSTAYTRCSLPPFQQT
jgi:hypothetical protein